MQLTPNNLQSAFLAFDTQFQAALTATPVYWNRFASLVPSNTREQRHAWLDRVPELKKWLGERQVENLKARVQVLVNEKYELTVAIEREEFEDDQYNVYGPAVQQMGESTAQWPDSMLLPVVQNGDQSTAVTYDGANFFSTSHFIDASNPALGTQSNLFNSLPLTAANYQTVRSAMMSMLGANGVPLNVFPDTLLVPPQLERTARTILNAEIIATSFQAGAVVAAGGSTSAVTAAAGETNVLKGTADVVVWPRLASDPTSWYLLCTKRAMKPFIFQQRIAPEFAYLNRPTDPNVFMQDEYLYGVRARGAAGYGLWWLAAKGKA